MTCSDRLAPICLHSANCSKSAVRVDNVVIDVDDADNDNDTDDEDEDKDENDTGSDMSLACDLLDWSSK